jgi:hypothetical protein
MGSFFGEIRSRFEGAFHPGNAGESRIPKVEKSAETLLLDAINEYEMEIDVMRDYGGGPSSYQETRRHQILTAIKTQLDSLGIGTDLGKYRQFITEHGIKNNVAQEILQQVIDLPDNQKSN